MNLILGAGLAGLSCSHHLGHGNCLLLEKAGHAFGHIHTEIRDGFTWDEGPHVSFTKSDYVRELFAGNVDGEFDEYPVQVGNYHAGDWIDHPAQSNLHQVPEPLRTRCLESFLATRSADAPPPANYAEWLRRAFGPVFAEQFPFAYTRKYWTRRPEDLATSWVGERVFQPKVEDVVAGSRGPLDRQTHYVTSVRYPRRGGYQSFAARLAEGARIAHGAEVLRIDLAQRKLWTADGRSFAWDRLINTLPLPVFLAACVDVPAPVIDAARALSCSSLVLVNVAARHPTVRPENWIYVYDEDKLSTRINCTEKLTPGNAPAGWTGVQVEVYGSRHRPFEQAPGEIGRTVVRELLEMGLVRASGTPTFHTRHVAWANVIFDHETAPALDTIFHWLEQHGLPREADDLHPLTDWANAAPPSAGSLLLAGRFGQWKYYWTDDCVLRGRLLQESAGGTV